MIHPSCAEVLATVQTGFERDVVPHLNDTEARSAAATIGHLLRHVALRIEDEGQILSDDIARLRGLLGQIAAWLEAEGAGEAASLRAALAQDLPPGVYPSLRLLGELALKLRAALVEAQGVLASLRATHGDDPAWQGLRKAISTYGAEQLADETRLIEPAFLGKGPRR